jgi:nucleoid-associated protein YgaU
MAQTQLTVAPGDDLFRIAAEYYGDATAWTLIARANSLTDPVIQANQVIIIPPYNANRANNGILASQ